MDELHFGNVKAEKAIAMRRYNLFAAVSKTLRILELCVALIFLSWILTRLPFAFRVSAEYLRKLSAFAATPLFVFALSNAIIAALLAQRSAAAAANADSSDAAAAADELYEEFLKNRSAVAERAKPLQSEAAAPPHTAATEAEYEDKKVVSETSAAVDRTVRDSDRGLQEYRRSQSEKWKGEEGGKTMLRRKQLRRSETEKVREDRREDDDLLYPQDKLSSEEFQRTIEAFIAKQMRFLREESSAIVVQNPS